MVNDKKHKLVTCRQNNLMIKIILLQNSHIVKEGLSQKNKEAHGFLVGPTLRQALRPELVDPRKVCLLQSVLPWFNIFHTDSQHLDVVLHMPEILDNVCTPFDFRRQTLHLCVDFLFRLGICPQIY